MSDPEDRLDAEGILALPAFEANQAGGRVRHPVFEPTCARIDRSLEDEEKTLEQWKQLILDEIADYQAHH